MRKKYPSQIRYEEKNPIITFRVTKEEKELIEQMANKARESISTLVRMALLNLEKQFTLALTEAEGKGYQKAKSEYEITYPCNICGILCTIIPNSDCHIQVKQFLKEKGWVHTDCLNKRK